MSLSISANASTLASIAAMSALVATSDLDLAMSAFVLARS